MKEKREERQKKDKGKIKEGRKNGPLGSMLCMLAGWTGVVAEGPLARFIFFSSNSRWIL